MTRKEFYQLTYEVNAAAIEVHKFLGPGLLESVYQKCLAEELKERGIRFLAEMAVPVLYKGEIDQCAIALRFPCGKLYRD